MRMRMVKEGTVPSGPARLGSAGPGGVTLGLPPDPSHPHPARQGQGATAWRQHGGSMATAWRQEQPRRQISCADLLSPFL